MRVNISGRGIIPILGTVAPAYNVELSESQVKRLLNFPMFRVFVTDTGKLITKGNINEIFSVQSWKNSKETAIDYVKNVVAPKVETPVIDKPVEESNHSEQVEIEEASNVDDIKTEDDTPTETVETEAVSEEVSIIDDEPVEEDESSDASTQHIEDNSSETYVRRNKKKKRH